MFTEVCPGCGLFHTEKKITVHGKAGLQKCLSCGFEYTFRAPELTIVIGASGSGKSTLALRMQREQTEYIVFDCDLLWRKEYTERPEDFYETWLQMILNIGQSGKPVILFASGMPDQYASFRYSRYFGRMNFIGLTASGESIRTRLLARPAWRSCADPGFIDSMLHYNEAIRTQFVYTIDTSVYNEEECIRRILEIAGNGCGS